ncbi:hypothetical protein CSUB01_09864 [Colletotrichum sublineola]|uniref:Uncharacterized protein n=1 Tax=Colletotrichum sublineola TaxID=1173701 RepID=A0A066X7L8_COLSU|nr:hypothetical protein CSUB01_09864 [Colletotrichum sublineola]
MDYARVSDSVTVLSPLRESEIADAAAHTARTPGAEMLDTRLALPNQAPLPGERIRTGDRRLRSEFGHLAATPPYRASSICGELFGLINAVASRSASMRFTVIMMER